MGRGGRCSPLARYFDRLEELQEENREVFVAALDYWEVNGLTTKGYVRPFKGRERRLSRRPTLR